MIAALKEDLEEPWSIMKTLSIDEDGPKSRKIE